MTPSSTTSIGPATEHPSAPARPLFWLALIALAVSIATVVGLTAYSRNMQRWVEHTTLVYQTTRSALLDLTGALPGEAGDANVVGRNPSRAIARLDSVGTLTANNPEQQRRIRGVRELAGQWAIAERDRTPVAPGLASAIRADVGNFLAEEQRLYRVRSDRFGEIEQTTAVAVALELVCVGFVIVAYSRRIKQHLAAATEQQLRLEEQAAELEEQTLELELTNQELREAAERADRE